MLDFETKETIMLLATAELPNKPSKTSQAQITVRVIDENDNPPVFISPSSYKVRTFYGCNSVEICRFNNSYPTYVKTFCANNAFFAEIHK